MMSPKYHAEKPEGLIKTSRAWLLLALMWIAYCLNYGDRQLIFSMFPVLKSELRLTDMQLGLLGSLFFWTYGLSSPFAGQVAGILFAFPFWLFLKRGKEQLPSVSETHKKRLGHR
jgi:sugar phosphate permease